MRQSAFEITMLGELNSLYGLAIAMTLCTDRANELSHLSFENAMNKVRAGNCIASSPRVLLFRSLYQTLCVERSHGITDSHPEVNLLETPEALDGARNRSFGWMSHADQLKPALESLPTQLRFVLYLWAVEDVPLYEIADVLELSNSEVCTRLKQARHRLCQLLAFESTTERLMSAPGIGNSFYGDFRNR